MFPPLPLSPPLLRLAVCFFEDALPSFIKTAFLFDPSHVNSLFSLRFQQPVAVLPEAFLFFSFSHLAKNFSRVIFFSAPTLREMKPLIYAAEPLYL